MSQAVSRTSLAAIAAVALLAGLSPAAAQGRPFPGLANFDGVELAGPDNVTVNRGRGFSVTAEGDPKILDQLDIYVRSGVLHVERKKRSWGGWFSSESGRGVTVHVTLPALRRASVAGSGDMRVDMISGPAIQAAIAGSGNLSIDRVDSPQAKLSIAGSGTLTAAGRTQSADVSIAGSGDVRADRLASDRASVSIAGSGDVYLRATQQANVSIIGSGDATIRGTSNCKVSKMGSGDARCAV